MIRSYGITIQRDRPHRQCTPITGRRTDNGWGGNGGVGIVVMKASRSEAARAAVRADESDVAGTPTQRPRKLSKRGRARCGTHRTGYKLAVLRRRGGLGGGDASEASFPLDGLSLYTPARGAEVSQT